jgi:hypothetical protein
MFGSGEKRLESATEVVEVAVSGVLAKVQSPKWAAQLAGIY